MGDVFLGCSGWHYKDWVGPFYTAEDKSKLALTLTAFMPEKIEQMGLAELLHVFMHDIRIKRVKGIKDSDVTVQEVTDNRVKALIREYHLSIDVSNRLVMHDCADWSRCAPVKQFCKHVGKAMMVIPEDKAIIILRKMASERDKWEFKPYMASTET